jgi:hypothetical protein
VVEGGAVEAAGQAFQLRPPATAGHPHPLDEEHRRPGALGLVGNLSSGMFKGRHFVKLASSSRRVK